MRLFRSARWILMALFLCLVPASSYAGVFISVGFAPPVLPVYEQPPCPEPGLMWTPGYWAYGEDGYYWVPGAWVPAPYEGALWTPGYWGWSGGLYVWHGGYWGPHVGYYGGVNYGFGYMGIGFAGGMWRGHDFVYNTAVVHVNERFVHTTYVDRTIVEHNTIVNDRHVAFSGGPGGIRHDPAPEERMAMNEHHLAPTSYQTQHMNAAMSDHNSYFKFEWRSSAERGGFPDRFRPRTIRRLRSTTIAGRLRATTTSDLRSRLVRRIIRSIKTSPILPRRTRIVRRHPINTILLRRVSRRINIESRRRRISRTTTRILRRNRIHSRTRLP
jgi:hypothetical protein